jgi:hypothetical protein
MLGCFPSNTALCLKQDERIQGKLSEVGLKDSKKGKMPGYFLLFLRTVPLASYYPSIL